MDRGKEMQNIANNCDIRRVKLNVAAGTGNVTTDTVDMSGYEGVAFVVHLGAITATGVPSVKVRQGQQSNMSDGADLAGSLTTGDDTYADKLMITDVYRPTERYVDAVIGRATANVEIDSVEAILYKAIKVPTDQHSTVASRKVMVSGGEGTA